MKTLLAIVVAVIVGIVSLVYSAYWLAALAFGGLLGHFIGVSWMTYHIKEIAPEEYQRFKERQLGVIHKGLDVFSNRYRQG